jgi:16S rRNA processing protein RimM
VVRADPALLEGRDELLLGDARVRVERRAGTAERPILRVAGHASREAAEALRGTPLSVLASEAPPLEEGEFWAHELEGCRVTDGERELGVVARMIALPSCEALEVGDRMIPMVGDAIRSIDLRARRIDVDSSFLGD